MTDERRAQILTAVERWLTEHPDDPLPAGVDPALAASTVAAPDLFALTGAIVACRHDVQIFGKACKRLEEKVDSLIERAPAAEPAEPAEPTDAASEESVWVDDLLDVFDRLRRCAVACADAPQGGLPFVRYRRLRAHVDGIAQGVAMTLDRLREVLARVDVRPFDPIGEVFDAARMCALGTAPADGKIGDGRVAETIKVGFVQAAAVVRPAEVRVAREEQP